MVNLISMIFKYIIIASTCDKSRVDLSLAWETDPNMSVEFSRSIASAMSQVVQRAVDEAL